MSLASTITLKNTMMPNVEVRSSIPPHVTLVAVSKTKPVSAIEEVYAEGIREFGENRVQELVEKNAVLPSDINWHAIGHLQTNKVKQVVGLASLIHAVDSTRLFDAIEKQASKTGCVQDVLLQVHIAEESSKFGFDAAELEELLGSDRFNSSSVRVRGLMGMATFTDDTEQVRREFKGLKELFDKYAGGSFDTLSMGMSGDYKIAIEEGSTMVRIGSAIFGSRG